MKTDKEVALSKQEQNKDLVRRAIEQIWNGKNYGTIGEFVSPDFVVHSATPSDEIHGLENAKQFYIQLHKAFPDIHFNIVDQVAEGDKVATRWIAQGTHKGEFKGIPPTGKPFKINAIDIDKIIDGKVVDCWTHMDELGLLQQLGIITA